MQRADGESQSRIERSVDSQMSSREDSLAVSDNEREPATEPNDRCVDEKVANEVGKAVNVVSSASLTDPVSTKVMSCENIEQIDEKGQERNLLRKQQIRKVGKNLRKL